MLYYKASGKTSEFFIPYFILVMLVAIPFISVAYVYLVHFIPFVYLNFFLAAGCGLAIGSLVNHTVDYGRARSPFIVLLFTLIAIGALKYFQWCVYIPMVVSDVYGFPMTIGERFAQTFFYLARPGDVNQAAGIINEFGVWGFTGKMKVTGALLHLIWIGEIILMACAAVVSSWDRPRRPFSEEVGDWYDAMDENAEFDMPGDADALRRKMATGEFADLPGLAAEGKSDEEAFMRLTFFKPPPGSASEPYYMTVDRAVQRNNKIKTKTLAEYLAIDARRVREILGKELVESKTAGDAVDEKAAADIAAADGAAGAAAGSVAAGSTAAADDGTASSIASVGSDAADFASAGFAEADVAATDDVRAGSAAADGETEAFAVPDFTETDFTTAESAIAGAAGIDGAAGAR
jgi:hypothetical protein